MQLLEEYCDCNFNLFIPNKMRTKKIPPLVKLVLNDAAKAYSESPATTNAGRVLRFISRFITVDTVIQLFAHKLRK